MLVLIDGEFLLFHFRPNIEMAPTTPTNYHRHSSTFVDNVIFVSTTVFSNTFSIFLVPGLPDRQNILQDYHPPFDPQLHPHYPLPTIPNLFNTPVGTCCHFGGVLKWVFGFASLSPKGGLEKVRLYDGFVTRACSGRLKSFAAIKTNKIEKCEQQKEIV